MARKVYHPSLDHGGLASVPSHQALKNMRFVNRAIGRHLASGRPEFVEFSIFEVFLSFLGLLDLPDPTLVPNGTARPLGRLMDSPRTHR